MATDARGHTVPTGSDFAARKSLTDLSLSISDIPARASSAAMGLLISDLAGAGITPSASEPIYCYRTDLAALLATADGSTWTQLTPGVCDLAGTRVPGVSSWSASSLNLFRLGPIVFCEGIIKTSGTISAGTATNSSILVVPTGWIPSPDLYGTAFAASIATWVNGATYPYAADSTLIVSTANGNVSMNVARTATEMRVSCHWRIA